MEKELIIKKMTDFYRGNVHDVEHFLKVYAYAFLIAKLEGLTPELTDTVELAAIVHDIACPVCREKYGNANGKYQEVESEALLIPFLEEFSIPEGIKDRVIYLVSHHHTYEGVDGIDYQILLEADFLVNAAESGYKKDAVREFYDRYAKTDSGRSLLESIYLRADGIE